MQGCSQLSGVIQAMLDYQKIKSYYWWSGHIPPETKITWKNTYVPFLFAAASFYSSLLFLFPFSFLLMLCLYDADESAVASVQSLGLFCADVTAALHNLCLSCSLQSHLLCALTAVSCTCETSPAKSTSTWTQQQQSVRHLLLKEMLRLLVQIIWTLFWLVGTLFS